ncbi:MAG: hypothetical protein ISS78_05430 [Phycisphaerae bacterium]|nr:hypothetical protein [Phycisphaerae bacterium]
MTDKRQDDRSIPDREDLLRWIIDDWLTTDKTTGEKRIKSSAFSDRQGEISVDLSSETTVEETFARGPDTTVGVIAVVAGYARSLDQIVVRDPIPDNRAHALICGTQTKSTRRKLAKASQWKCRGGEPPQE